MLSIPFGIHGTQASLLWSIQLATALKWVDLPCGISRAHRLQGAARLLRKFSWVWVLEGNKHVSP